MLSLAFRIGEDACGIGIGGDLAQHSLSAPLGLYSSCFCFLSSSNQGPHSCRSRPAICAAAVADVLPFSLPAFRACAISIQIGLLPPSACQRDTGPTG